MNTVPTDELRMHGANARHIIVNCHALFGSRYRKSPLWSMVSDICGHGSGYSIEICRTANLDPHQMCGAKTLKEL